MSDYIKRKDALAFARHAYAKGLNVLSYLKEVPAADVRPVSEWISVNDKMPSKKGLYLVAHKATFGSGYITICGYAKNLERVDEFDFEGEKRCGWYKYESEYGFLEITNITHWQPLPKLPPIKAKQKKAKKDV